MKHPEFDGTYPVEKPCLGCGETKPLAQWGKDRSSPDGLRARCRVCHNKEARESYHNNREKVNARCKKYRLDNSEKCKATAEKYRQDNREKLKASSNKYYHDNTEKCSASTKKYRQANFGKIKARKKRWRLANPRRWWSKQTLCAHRTKLGCKVVITLDEMHARAEATDYCEHCKCLLDYGPKDRTGGQANSPSLDRKVAGSDILSMDDVWILCHKCNSTKGKRSMDEFCELAAQHTQNLRVDATIGP